MLKIVESFLVEKMASKDPQNDLFTLVDKTVQRDPFL